MMNLQHNHPQHTDDILNRSLFEILELNTLLSMANIRKSNTGFESWVCTAFYAFNNSLDLFILSEPDTQHIQNLIYNKSIAVSIYDSHQEPTQLKRGLQIFGSCERAEGLKLAEGYTLYAKRFIWLPDFIKRPEDFTKGIIQSKLFVVTTNVVKLFDEKIFGEEIWITLPLG